MEALLENQDTLTPRLLFELYVHKDNLDRTLVQGVFSNLHDDAKLKLKKRKEKNQGMCLI